MKSIKPTAKNPPAPRSRVEDRIKAWRIVVESTEETETSVLAFGRSDNRPVVLKVTKHPGDEWRSGEVLDAFDGKGVVERYDHIEGAILLERLDPATPLARMALDGNDDRATEVLANVIRKMSPRAVDTIPTVHDWAAAFDRYVACGDFRIPKPLVLEAQRVYSDLCASQARQRLLHGDLHHYNVLFDSSRGWVAIDPKGVVGELAYEVGAALRNPYERPELFIEPAAIQKRVQTFARELNLDPRRVLAWGFAQAVLSAIWATEDGFAITPGNSSIALANAIRPMLGGVLDS